MADGFSPNGLLGPTGVPLTAPRSLPDTEEAERERRLNESAFAHLRTYDTPGDARRAEARARGRMQPSHLKPNSVCIATLGHAYVPGAWAAQVDLYMHTRKHMPCWLDEIPNFSTKPHDMLGTMRHYAWSRARDSGFEWCLLIENDVLPEPDMLERLIARDCPIIAPFQVDEEKHSILQHPHDLTHKTGLKRASFVAMSCLLLSTRVLNGFAYNPFGDGQSVPEGVFYERLFGLGHQLWVDTDIYCRVMRTPSRPGMLSYRELDAAHELMYERYIYKGGAIPDRKPPFPGAPGAIRLPDGSERYAPFFKGVAT